VQCGDDGCGGTCAPGCTGGKVCGPDGTCVTDACNGVPDAGCCAGAILRYCDQGAIVNANCGQNTTPADQTCGWDTSSGYYDCGFTGADPSGTASITCPPCTGSCTGKECGDDGCGGTCGTACTTGNVCDQTGHCVADQCGGVTDVGCCSAAVNKWCQDGKVSQEDCGSESTTCGWDATNEYYGCGGQGADPSGTSPLACP